MVDAVAEDKATPAGTMPTTESPTPAASTEARAAEAADQAAKDKAAAGEPAPVASAGEPAKDEAAAPAPVVPETYDLKVPDGSLLDTGATERIAATARELGLSNEAAQKTVDLLDGEVQATVAAVLEAHQPGGAEWAKQEEAWKAEVMADASLGKTPEERKATIDKGRAVLRKFTDANPKDAEAFKGFLEGTGLGSQPAAVRFFAWLGKAMDEGKVITAPPGEGNKKPEHVLYNEDGSPKQPANS